MWEGQVETSDFDLRRIVHEKQSLTEKLCIASHASFLSGSGGFNEDNFHERVKSEMLKVVWPSWPELKGSTILVIILSAFFAIYIGGVDLILSMVRRMF